MLVFLAYQVLLAVTDLRDETEETDLKVKKEKEAYQEKQACRESKVMSVIKVWLGRRERVEELVA